MPHVAKLFKELQEIKRVRIWKWQQEQWDDSIKQEAYRNGHPMIYSKEKHTKSQQKKDI
jgi:hypothetical protein